MSQLAMLFVLFFSFVLSLISPVAAQELEGETPKPIGPPLAMQMWRITDLDVFERVTGGLMPGPKYILKHEGPMRVREIIIQEDVAACLWTVEFREIRHPLCGTGPRQSLQQAFRMHGNRQNMTVTCWVNGQPKPAATTKMGRFFLLSVAERVKKIQLPSHTAGPEFLHEDPLRTDILVLLNQVQFEDLVQVIRE